MDLRWMTAGDSESVAAASKLFDHDVEPAGAREFLDKPGHHLCIAYDADVPAGFVSGVETTHPDKGTEMFLYELGVDESFRGRGIGRALVQALAERAVTLGCYGMWVLTDDDNAAALATYRSAGSDEEDAQVMLGWRFSTRTQ